MARLTWLLLDLALVGAFAVLGRLSHYDSLSLGGWWRTAWPFVLGRSWILSRFGVPPGRLRIMGLALSAVTFAAFTLAALAVIGVLPAGLWLSAVAMGAGSSLALLVLFFHPWLVLGVAIDVLLLVAIFIGDWSAVTLPI